MISLGTTTLIVVTFIVGALLGYHTGYENGKEDIVNGTADPSPLDKWEDE